jgi:hypothetical protein
MPAPVLDLAMQDWVMAEIAAGHRGHGQGGRSLCGVSSA